MQSIFNINDYLILIDKITGNFNAINKSYYDYLVYRKEYFKLDYSEENVWLYGFENNEVNGKELKRKLKYYTLANTHNDHQNKFLEFDTSKIKLYQDLKSKSYFSFKQDIFQELIKCSTDNPQSFYHKEHLFFMTSYNSETKMIDISKEDIRLFKFSDLKKISI